MATDLFPRRPNRDARPRRRMYCLVACFLSAFSWSAAEEIPVPNAAADKHWAFQPLSQPIPPTVASTAWCRNAVDRFILRRLEDEGLSPNVAATNQQLIRRLSFDLVGLPPEPEDVATFCSDPSDTAYEELVDRLLASPRYGERWARHWLDVARFAESYGFEHDFDIDSAFHYRDFVIQALNQGMPYDRFVRFQLAGDELASSLDGEDSRLAWMATGFLTAGVHNYAYAAIQVEKERYDELDDMVSTLGTAMLGLTLGCARCHEHKYDPVSQEEYYRLAATFSTTVRSEVELDFDPTSYPPAKEKFDDEHAPLVAALEHFERHELPARLDAWLATGAELPPPPWLVITPLEARSERGATLTKQDDGSYLASEKTPSHDRFTFVAETPIRGIRSVRLEALADTALPSGGPGRSSNGNFVLTDFRVTATPLSDDGEPVEAEWAGATETFHQNGLPARSAIDDDEKSGWAIHPRVAEDHAAIFELKEPLGFEGGTKLTLELEFQSDGNGAIGRPRLSISTREQAPSFSAEETFQETFVSVTESLKPGREPRTDAQKTALKRLYRLIDPEWTRLNTLVGDHLEDEPKRDLRKVLVATEGLEPHRIYAPRPAFYETTYFLEGGDTKRKRDAVAAGFPAALVSASNESVWKVYAQPESTTSFRRTALARWITDPDNGAGHLLARVIVNRLWQHHFGRGIAAMPSDFGRQGEPPTHPALLDWLAGELIREGWRLKPIHRLIVTSAAYRQSARAVAPGSLRRDPENRLFGRRSVQRLEAETIRDSMLAVGSILDQTRFGPGTLDQGMRRRSIYFTVKRSMPISLLALFDAPDGLVGIGQRPTTIVAPQALAMMNNVYVRGYAEAFARRVIRSTDRTAGAVIERAYRIALGRSPNEEETVSAQLFLERGIVQESIADLCHGLFCLNEFLFVE